MNCRSADWHFANLFNKKIICDEQLNERQFIVPYMRTYLIHYIVSIDFHNICAVSPIIMEINYNIWKYRQQLVHDEFMFSTVRWDFMYILQVDVYRLC